MSRWASGVAVVTAPGEGEGAGMTATAFSSLSLEPPLVLVCVGHASVAHDALVGAPAFAVHLLDLHQRDLSDHFARPEPDLVAAVPHGRGPEGVPLLPLGVARLVCARERTVEAGDHTILIGLVVDVAVTRKEPLLHVARTYRRTGPPIT
jgi:flavin reductase (DIM6/NTAB) family NADH-FMN oxidoreductase RutF